MVDVHVHTSSLDALKTVMVIPSRCLVHFLEENLHDTSVIGHTSPYRAPCL